MKYFLVVFFVFALKMVPGWSINPFAKWTKTELVLDNGVVQRTIKLPSPEGNFVTTSYKPVKGDFDYFLKTNTETKDGGIIGVFRHGSVESSRIVTVNWLDPLKTYQVRSLDGKVVATLTGSALKSQGFTLTLTELYSGELFEICVNKTDLSPK